VGERDIFIFLNKRCTHIKLLLMKPMASHCCTGGCTKAGLAAAATGGTIHLSSTELLSMLSGLHLHRTKKRA
jgi:hypothetical protein